MRTNIGNIVPTDLTIYIDDNAVAASSTLTWDNAVNFADGETVTIGTTVYRFKDTMAQAYDVKVGADGDTSLANLVKAINASGTAGVEYYTGTLIHPTVSAAAVASHATIVTAKTAGYAGNSIATSETSAHAAWTGSYLAGGGSTIGTASIGSAHEGGLLHRLICVAPQWAGTPTYTIAILNEDGITIYSNASQAENTTTATALEVMIAPTDTVKVTTTTKVEETIAITVMLR